MRRTLAMALALAGILVAGCTAARPRALDDDHDRPSDTPPTTQHASEVLAWLVQDVCDADPTKDPYVCPSGTHDLASGEHLFYDRKGANRDDQIHNGFPSAVDGEVVVNTFDYEPFHAWTPEKDGYDVVETSGPWASITDTRDPGGLAQSWTRWRDGVVGGIREWSDNWILLPVAIPSPGETGGTASHGHQLSWEANSEARGAITHCCRPVTYTGADTPPEVDLASPCNPYAPAPCHGELEAYTSWTRGPKTYTHDRTLPDGADDRTLDTIVATYTYGSAVFSSETATGKEVFYFTKTYGLTRWEAWRVDPKGKLDDTTQWCNGPVTEADRGRTWTRIDCREWTHVVSNPAGFDPATWPAPLPTIPSASWDASSQMAHATGVSSAGGWSADPRAHDAGALVVGPELGLAPGRYTASFRMQALDSEAGVTAVTADVFDVTTGAVDVARDVTASSIVGAAPDVDLDMAVSTPDHRHQLRLFWYGSVPVTVERARLGQRLDDWAIRMDAIVRTATDPEMGHATGAARDRVWAAKRGVDSAGWLVDAMPLRFLPGARIASWSIALESAPIAASTPIATIDVYDASAGPSGRVVATRTIAASELPMGRAVSVSIPFAANGTHVYYARVFWHATADVAVASLDVR